MKRSLAFAFCLVSSAPVLAQSGRPVAYVFSPTDSAHSKTYFENGVEEHFLQDGGGLYVTASGVEGADKRTLMVGLGFRLDGDRELLVDPTRCSLRMSNGDLVPAADGDVWLAKDRKHQLRKQVWSNLAGAGVTGLTATRTATYSDNLGYRGTLTYTDSAAFDAESDRELNVTAKLLSRLDTSNGQLLRKSTLLNGTQVEGKVYFSVPGADRKATPSAVVVEIADEVFTFPF